jgi:hypothetical protein
MWRGMGRRAHVDHHAGELREFECGGRRADGDATRAMQTGLVLTKAGPNRPTLVTESPAPVGTASPVQFDSPENLNFKP